MNNILDLRQLKEKNIYPLGIDFQGKSENGEEISFTNYYMQKMDVLFSVLQVNFTFQE